MESATVVKSATVEVRSCGIQIHPGPLSPEIPTFTFTSTSTKLKIPQNRWSTMERRTLLNAFTSFLVDFHQVSDFFFPATQHRWLARGASHPCSPHVMQDLEAVLEQPDPDRGYGFEVSVVELAYCSFAAASQLLADPITNLELFELAAIEAQSQILQLHHNRHTSAACAVHAVHGTALHQVRTAVYSQTHIRLDIENSGLIGA